ncbi:hypothetical protein D0469_05775 [Peribacillus saganii]|uniref:Uncharacterized protein n=1 Tax=Peribacillus saganii TaxID=2303992 RepID=A0A372LS71_9BACI|nr:hypothetical protein [Peribacillus saganii]RFU70642.1 hypothetical protein D0469_05775 [Peribacillus saganii]
MTPGISFFIIKVFTLTKTEVIGWGIETRFHKNAEDYAIAADDFYRMERKKRLWLLLHPN